MLKKLLPLLLCAGVLLTPAGLYAKTDHKSVRVVVGKADTITVGHAMADVLVADPSIVDVGALKSDQLFLVGLKTGSTNILVFDKGGQQIAKYDLHVAVDNTTLQGTIDQLVPDQNIKVSSVNNDIVLSGLVDNPMNAARAADIASRFSGKDEKVINMMRIKAEQQVTLKVKIVEASKQMLKELGLEGNTTLGQNFGNFDGSNLATTAATGLTKEPLGIGSVIYDTVGLGRLNLILRALEENNLVNTLAEPNLTAISGQKAGFLVGGELPIPTGRDQYGNIIIEYKKYGVSLNFKPTVMSSERISLQLSTEVSAPTTENALTITSITVPSLTVSRAETTVELNSGGSLMIAGLLQSKTTAGMNQIPGAKDAPILGDLLKSQSFNRDETELLVLVTAYLVKPYDDETETKRADVTEGQETTVTRSMDVDLQQKLKKRFGTKYDRALTAVPEGATYALD